MAEILQFKPRSKQESKPKQEASNKPLDVSLKLIVDAVQAVMFLEKDKECALALLKEAEACIQTGRQHVLLASPVTLRHRKYLDYSHPEGPEAYTEMVSYLIDQV